jgi:hypothetical protein
MRHGMRHHRCAVCQARHLRAHAAGAAHPGTRAARERASIAASMTDRSAARTS